MVPRSFSESKLTFLAKHIAHIENNTNPETASLTISQLHTLADRYKRDFFSGTEIIINGETLYGQLLISANIRLIERIQANPINTEFDGFLYAIYLAYYWKPQEINNCHLLAHTSMLIQDIIKTRCLDQITLCKLTKTEEEAIKNLFTELAYLDADGKIKPLSELQLRRLVFRLSDLFHYELKKTGQEPGIFVFKGILLDEIKKLSKIRRERICLNRFQAMKEMESIQGALKKIETIGYVFTNDEREGDMRAHTEGFIITDKGIAKPLHWIALDEKITFKAHQFPQLYVSEWFVGAFRDDQNCLDPELAFNLSTKNQPQRGLHGCGTFTMQYLKHLLENKAKQFNDYSLMIPLYSTLFDSDKSTLQFIFIPPPHVLRYSQSETYNDMLARFVRGENIKYRVGLAYDKVPLDYLSHAVTQLVDHTAQTASARNLSLTASGQRKLRSTFFNDLQKDASLSQQVKTPNYISFNICQLLCNSHKIATECGDLKTAENNKKLIDSLTQFQTRWLDEYDKESEKRSSLTNPITGKNWYLTYESTKAVDFANQYQVGKSFYLMLMDLKLAPNFQYIQTDFTALIQQPDFQSLHYRDQNEIALGFLCQALEQHKHLRRKCIFPARTYLGQSMMDINAINHFVIKPWMHKIFVDDEVCVMKFNAFQQKQKSMGRTFA